MNIDKKFVKKVADLSMLVLSEEEISGYVKDMDGILKYVDLLDEVQVDGIEATSQVTGLQSVFREDVVQEYLSDKREKLLREAPEVENGYIVVPKTL